VELSSISGNTEELGQSISGGLNANPLDHIETTTAMERSIRGYARRL
jgi:hypothetical protein